MGPFLRLGNNKTVRLDDLPPEAWSFLVGGPEEAPDLRKYYKSIAWLNRGVRLRANHVTKVPFKILKGNTELDTSDDYQNMLPFLSNPKRLLWLVETGLTLAGKAYQRIERSAVMGKAVPSGLQHLKATTMKPVYAKTADPEADVVIGELLYFEREAGAGVEVVPLDDVVYFWAPDDEVEIGPPNSYPALAALQAAGALYAVSDFATMFFERGAIKVTLLTTKGNVLPAERSRIKAWWDRIRGNSWASEVVNADQLEVVPVGEGLESLSDTELTTEQREDVATALGVPHSMLFSNAANYATSQQDKLNFYEDTIIPECEIIQEVLNEQLLEPLGYRLIFDPNSMNIFQEDEEQRSASMYNLVAAGWRPSIAGETLGYNLPDGVEFIDLDEKYDISLEAATNAAQPVEQEEEQDAAEAMAEGNNPRQLEKALVQADMDKWERKALKRIQRGNDPACVFESEHIPILTIASIEGALESTTNKPDLVRSLFKDVWVDYP